jgi:hypothetical protein
MVASTTGAGFTNFMTPSTNKNSAANVLTARPVQSLRFEMGAF